MYWIFAALVMGGIALTILAVNGSGEPVCYPGN